MHHYNEHKESVHGLKIKAKRYLGSGSTPLDAQFDIFVFQDGIDPGYLRVPTVYYTKTVPGSGGDGDKTWTGEVLAEPNANLITVQYIDRCTTSK